MNAIRHARIAIRKTNSDETNLNGTSFPIYWDYTFSNRLFLGAQYERVDIRDGIGSGIVMTLGADASPAEARPQFLGGWRLFADLGSACGPLLVSAITLVAPLAVAVASVGALSIAGGGWLARWVPRFDPRARSRRAAGSAG